MCIRIYIYIYMYVCVYVYMYIIFVHINKQCVCRCMCIYIRKNVPIYVILSHTYNLVGDLSIAASLYRCNRETSN